MSASTSNQHFRVGLTGGIGSGKSTVADVFAALGITVVDADVVARQVVAPGTAALRQITDFFGPSVLSGTGELDRTKLREIVFSDPEAKTWLNQLLHPLIRQHMLQQLETATSPYSLLVAPLLLENRLDQFVDKVLVVDVTVETQLRRTMQRDHSPEALVQSIIAAQCSRAGRLERADFVISNEGPTTLIADKVAELHQIFLRLAEEKLAKSLT